VTILVVAVGSGLGAALRYLTDRALATWLWAAFPWGTLAVNIAGTFGLGLLVGAVDMNTVASAALGVGLCGGLTTYSSFGYETVRLFRNGSWLLGVLNATANLGACLAAAVGGLALGSQLG